MHAQIMLALTVLSSCFGSEGVSGGGVYDGLWRPSAAAPGRATGTHQTIEPGKSLVIANLEGPGVIRHIWFTAGLGTPDEVTEFHRGVVIRAYWDDEKSPSVEAPFGDFFAVGHGVQRPFQCAVLSMTPYENNVRAGFNCYFPMPFKKRAKLVLSNEMGVAAKGVYWHIDYERDASMAGDVMTFHATYRASRPVTREVPHVMCEAEGRGKYVGTVWSVHLLAGHSWVESREDFYVDGAAEPTLPGTGSEDYYGQAWGYREQLQTDYLGTSVCIKEGFGKWTAYRLHLVDPIPFGKSIRVTMADRGYDIGYRSDDFATVTYWYQMEPHKAHPALPPYEDRLPADHEGSHARGLETIRDMESKGDLEGAARAATLLMAKHPDNPLTLDVACLRGDLLERSGKLDEAKAAYRKVAASTGNAGAAKAAADKLWMLDGPGRALLKAYASSGVEVFLDGQAIHKDGPWCLRDLKVARVETTKGSHVLGVHAICRQDEPFRYLRLGTLQLWLDVPGKDIQADRTWKISPGPVEGWEKAGFEASGWVDATEHAGLPDEAWLRLSGAGLRTIAYPIKRIWSVNCNPFRKDGGACFEHLYARCEVEVP
ncbi:MAG: DUF2961 domain-containing protein [Phycisphaerae bacterium]|nr:DUF2961 domain-containing protein [Phycisphaerae bacterium]